MLQNPIALDAALRDFDGAFVGFEMAIHGNKRWFAKHKIREISGGIRRQKAQV